MANEKRLNESIDLVKTVLNEITDKKDVENVLMITFDQIGGVSFNTTKGCIENLPHTLGVLELAKRHLLQNLKGK